MPVPCLICKVVSSSSDRVSSTSSTVPGGSLSAWVCSTPRGIFESEQLKRTTGSYWTCERRWKSISWTIGSLGEVERSTERDKMRRLAYAIEPKEQGSFNMLHMGPSERQSRSLTAVSLNLVAQQGIVMISAHQHGSHSSCRWPHRGPGKGGVESKPEGWSRLALESMQRGLQQADTTVWERGRSDGPRWTTLGK